MKCMERIEDLFTAVSFAESGEFAEARRLITGQTDTAKDRGLETKDLQRGQKNGNAINAINGQEVIIMYT